jgi:hypothetical protein
MQLLPSVKESIEALQQQQLICSATLTSLTWMFAVATRFYMMIPRGLSTWHIAPTSH